MNRIFVKGYGFLFFAKTTIKNISKKISENFTVKSTTDALKTTSNKIIQKTAEATGDLIGHKIGSKIKKSLRILPKNSSGIVTNETEDIGLYREIPKERYISPEKDSKLLMIQD